MLGQVVVVAPALMLGFRIEAGDDGYYARHLLGFAGVNGNYVGMGMGAVEGTAMEHAMELHVAGVTGTTGYLFLRIDTGLELVDVLEISFGFTVQWHIVDLLTLYFEKYSAE